MRSFSETLTAGLLLACGVAANDDLWEAESFSTYDCIELDASGVAGLMYFPPSVGGWVDDSGILIEKWVRGMEMKALDYCLDDTELSFISMQLILRSEEEGGEDLKLLKHGGEGG